MRPEWLRRGFVMCAVAALAIACGGPAPHVEPSAYLTVRDGGAGGVTVEATWVTPAHVEERPALRKIASRLPGNAVLIHVKLDTHSVDLGRYELAALAWLDGGSGLKPALSYEPISDEGHHREGVLVFDAPGTERPATLIIRDLAGVPDAGWCGALPRSIDRRSPEKRSPGAANASGASLGRDGASLLGPARSGRVLRLPLLPSSRPAKRR